MCPASHSSRSRTSRICTPSRALVQLGHGQPRDRLGRQPLLAPARHPARQVARDLPDADRRGELHRAQRIGVVAADEHDRVVGPGDPRQPRAEARPAGRCWRSRPGCGPRRTAARCGCRSPAPRTARPGAASAAPRRADGARSGPRLIATIALKFGGCGRSPAVVRATNSSSSVTPSSVVVAALVADRRGHLEVHRRPAAQRAAQVPGPDLDVVSELEQRRAARRRSRARPPPSRPPGPGARCRPRTASRRSAPPTARAPRAVSIKRERRVLGPVPGRVQRAHDHAAQRQLPAVLEGLVLVLGLRAARGCGSARRSPPPAGRGR